MPLTTELQVRFGTSNYIYNGPLTTNAIMTYLARLARHI
jgi:hypothetical protein